MAEHEHRDVHIEEQMNAYMAKNAHKDVKIEDLQKLVIHLRHQHEQQQQQHEHALKEQQQQHRKQQQQQQAAQEAAAAGLRRRQAEAWSQDFEKCTRMRLKTIEHVLKNWLRGTVLRAFLNWKNALDKEVSAIVADRFMRVMLRSQFDLVSFAFHKVKTFARVTSLKTILLRKVALGLLGNLRTVMFARWKFLMRDHAHRYTLAERSRKVVLKTHRIYTNLVFARWKQKSLNLRRKRVGAMRAIVRMLMRLQRWSLDQWHCNCCWLKRQRGDLMKAIRRWHRQLLLSTFLVFVFSHLYCIADEFITRFCWPIASLTAGW
jgi:hypothetical protein